MKRKLFFIRPLTAVLAIAVAASCTKRSDTDNAISNPVAPNPEFDKVLATQATGGTLLFRSGFEAGSTSNGNLPRLTQLNDQKDKIIGVTTNLDKSDWSWSLEGGQPLFGTQYLNYEQGNYSQRQASIVADPKNANNKVLRFRITEKHITLRNPDGSIKEQKARIQMELRNEGTPPAGGFLKEYYQKVRIYFSPNFSVLEQAGTENVGWMIMQEFWNDPSWMYQGQIAHRPARTDVGLAVRGGKLRFAAGGRDPIMELPQPGNNSWHVINTNFAIPFGTWMTQEIYVKEGGSAGTANPGRFYMSITPDGGTKTVIVDKIGMTRSEEPGFFEDGQSSFNPMKIYTEGKVLDWFKNAGKTMDIYWDDLEIWRDRRP
ncbi:hypothetical protein A5893_13135 [Pedobacter psychrophilus]|uniref:Uncharacterized protein n=1 Tax=Pedobacter psychrophilus TaxID=1826909 RepID=A0A179DD44_9SPHI|nr:hypothetical protein [Pedobacter psychrophilus]OAQ38976.1 hypothetical protein A5893_13135 [Pedobacter psychrophilus]